MGGDEFSTTGFSILLRRATKSHLFNTYVPSGTLTFMSFISFLIPADVVPGRMALLVTIFLMLVNISTMSAHRGPVVSNLTMRVTHCALYSLIKYLAYKILSRQET